MLCEAAGAADALNWQEFVGRTSLFSDLRMMIRELFQLHLSWGRPSARRRFVCCSCLCDVWPSSFRCWLVGNSCGWCCDLRWIFGGLLGTLADLANKGLDQTAGDGVVLVIAEARRGEGSSGSGRTLLFPESSCCDCSMMPATSTRLDPCRSVPQRPGKPFDGRYRKLPI